MDTFNRTLIALDLSDADKNLFKAVNILGEPFEFKQVYYLHVVKDFTKPENLDVEFSKLFNPEYPADEKVRDKILLDIEEWREWDVDWKEDVEVVEGSPYQKLIHWLDVKMVDLLVVGNKKVSQGSGITVKRVVRNSETNVFFVPSTGVHAIGKIVVPIDFSDRSKRAIETAAAIAGNLDGNVELIALHVIPQPSSVFYEPGTRHTAFQKALHDSAEQSFQKLFDESTVHASKAKQELVYDDYNSISLHIHEYSQKEEADLIVMGAKGHSALNNLLLGSITESLADRCKDIPLLVVR